MIRACLLLGLLLAWPLAAAPRVIQIGIVGSLTGTGQEALLSRQCAEISAELVNEQGGLLVGGMRYRVEIVTADSGGDPYQAMRAQRALTEKGVRYFIGPYTRPALRLVAGLGEITGSLNIAYADDDLYGPGRRYLVYGDVPLYQRIPVLYRYLSRQGVKSVAFIARNDVGSLASRNAGISAAGELGMKLEEPPAASIDDITYGGGKSPPLEQLLESFAALAPDAIVLTDVRDAEVAALVKGLRGFGYRGLVATDHHLPAAGLKAAGRTAEGFLAIGVTPGIETWSDYRKTFVKRFRARHGNWPDEAGSRAYAAEFLLRMIQATGPSALKNTRGLRNNMHDLPLADPFFRKERELRLIGGKRYGKNVQLNVPVVVKEIYDGRYRTRYVHDPS